jgi:hypothetical protein
VVEKARAAREGKASIKGFEEESKLLEEVSAQTTARAEEGAKYVEGHPEVAQVDDDGLRHAPVGDDHEIVEVNDASGVHCEFHSPGGKRIRCPRVWEAEEIPTGEEMPGTWGVHAE